MSLYQRWVVYGFFAFFLFIGSALVWSNIITAPPPNSLLTENCNPCNFAIGHNLPGYSICAKFRDLPDDMRIVESLKVFRDDKSDWLQTLVVNDMLPILADEEILIGTADINFDGYNDLFFATSRGVANTYSDYWLFNPAKEEFSYLGNYPIFSIDSEQQRLTTFERGGNGGMLYEKNDYQFIQGELLIVKSEKQESTQQEGVYRRSIYQHQDGKLQLIKQEDIKAPN